MFGGCFFRRQTMKSQNNLSQKKRLGRIRSQQLMTVLLFLLVPSILLFVFTYIPALNMVRYSFENRDQFGQNVTFCGFDNYKTVFTTPNTLLHSKTAFTTFAAHLSSSDLRFSLQLSSARRSEAQASSRVRSSSHI